MTLRENKSSVLHTILQKPIKYAFLTFLFSKVLYYIPCQYFTLHKVFINNRISEFNNQIIILITVFVFFTWVCLNINISAKKIRSEVTNAFLRKGNCCDFVDIVLLKGMFTLLTLGGKPKLPAFYNTPNTRILSALPHL